MLPGMKEARRSWRRFKLVCVPFFFFHLLAECMNCTSFNDMNSRINAVESKVRIKMLGVEKKKKILQSGQLLLSLQIKLLESGRSLPEVRLPDGSTGNEVDTRRATPPPYLPPGVSTSQKNLVEMFKNCLEMSSFSIHPLNVTVSNLNLFQIFSKKEMSSELTLLMD